MACAMIKDSDGSVAFRIFSIALPLILAPGAPPARCLESSDLGVEEIEAEGTTKTRLPVRSHRGRMLRAGAVARKEEEAEKPRRSRNRDSVCRVS